MGCKGSKASEDAVELDRTKAPASWSELDQKVAVEEEEPQENPRKRGSLQIDSVLVGRILEIMGANNDQKSFFQVWAKHVLDPALPNAVSNKESAGQQLFVSTDMRFLEVRVTSDSTTMRELIGNFVSKIKDLPTKSLNELNMVLDTLQDSKLMQDGTRLLTAWCKIKHCRADAPPPSVDCGYIINHSSLPWAQVDVLMPSHDDQDALRDYALAEKHVPSLYGSSILPIAPEKQIGFELHETAAANSRQILLTAFFFFKALGLMKPEDRIVRILNTCQSEQLVVCACIGPEGLVRLALTLIDPLTRNKEVAKELAEELAFLYREKDIAQIYQMMNGEPDVIDYVGETKGYGIRLGFFV